MSWTMIRTPMLALCLTLIAASPAAAHSVNVWGSNLGPETEELRFSPTPEEGLSEPVAIDASNSSGYALEANGTVKAWGDGGVGQLGDGTREDSSSAVTVQFPAGTVITSIGEAKDEGFAIDSTGHGWMWGANGYRSGCVPGTKQLVPVQISGLSKVVEVLGAENHSLWRKANGRVLGCGVNTVGQLGLGEAVDKVKTPTPIPGLSSITQISASDHTSEALNTSGRVFMAGENTEGQIGIGSSTEAIYSFTQVALPEAATYISDGGDFPPNGTAFAKTARALYGWGYNRQGQLGNGTTSFTNSPVNTGLHFATIFSGGLFVLGLDSEGDVFSWGSNAGGSLGTGSKGRKSTTPVFVEGGVSAISATARNAVDLH
jgi:alpha-tubulin suppressor-like RCC1 family protein